MDRVRRLAIDRSPFACIVACVALCWTSSGAAPLVDALSGVGTSADFARDYVTARARIEDGRTAPIDGTQGNDRARRMGVPQVVLLQGPYYLHPPPAMLVVLPLALLPWRWAAGIFAALSSLALAWLARSLLGIYYPGRARQPGPAKVVLLASALFLWPPALHCLEKGQWSILLAALVAAGVRAIEERRWPRAGVWLGVAAALKATPILLAGLMLERSRRGTLAMASTVALTGLTALGVVGAAFYAAFFMNASVDVAAWSTWVANTASLQGVLARLLQNSPFSRPAIVAPVAARAIFAAIAVLSLAAVGVAGRRRRRRLELVAAPGSCAEAEAEAASTARAGSLDAAAWLVLPVLLNPLGWTHVLLMLLPSMVLALRDGGRACRFTVALIFAVFSIPRQRLWAWAGPLPVAPWPGLILGTHAFAVLALYVVVLASGALAADPARRRS